MYIIIEYNIVNLLLYISDDIFCPSNIYGLNESIIAEKKKFEIPVHAIAAL